MRADDGELHRDVPVDLTRRVGRGLDLLERSLPRPSDGPEPVAFAYGLRRSCHSVGLPGIETCHHRQMVLVGEFFLAGDDESAVRVGPRKSHDFPAVPYDGIYPDDAVPRWEVLLTGVESPLRHVVPMANDGFTVFAVPQTLSTALASAGTDQLRTTALTWAETVSEMGDEIEPGSAVDLLEHLSALAASRAERGLSLYCWYFAP